MNVLMRKSFRPTDRLESGASAMARTFYVGVLVGSTLFRDEKIFLVPVQMNTRNGKKNLASKETNFLKHFSNS